MSGNKVYESKLNTLKTAAARCAIWYNQNKPSLQESPYKPLIVAGKTYNEVDLRRDLWRAAINYGSTDAVDQIIEGQKAADHQNRRVTHAILTAVRSAPGSKGNLERELGRLSREALMELLSAVRFIEDEAETNKRKARQGRW